MCGYRDDLRRLMDAELVDEIRDDEIVELIVDRILAAPVAEDLPSDLRRTPDEELEAPDVRVVVTARRGREKDGAPPLREAPEPKNLRARSPVVWLVLAALATAVGNVVET